MSLSMVLFYWWVSWCCCEAFGRISEVCNAFLQICIFCYLSAANCVPPCQNGGMCLRPQLCVCKLGTKGKACEKTAAQDTSSPVFGGQSLGAASSWSPPEQVAKHTASKKADTLPRVSPMAQMTLTLKPKPSVGLSQQIHSQWVFWTCLRLRSILIILLDELF